VPRPDLMSRNSKTNKKTKGFKTQVRRNMGKKTVIKKHPSLTMYNSPRIIMPAEFDVTLSYNVQTLVNNVGGLLASTRYGTNAYDVDPSIGSTAMPGFAEFAGFYAKFRTIAIGYKFSCANKESFPVTIIHGFSNSVVASGSLNIPYVGNPFWGTTIAGPLTGMCKATVFGKRSVCEITGTQQPLFDDLYTGSTTSSTLATGSTKWAYLGLVSDTLMVSGVIVNVHITLDIRFFYMNFLLT
jgi:hypothetical protein